MGYNILDRLESGSFGDDIRIMMHRTIVFVSIAVLFAALLPQALGADKATVDKKKVYYGDAESFSKPAEIEINKVFARIPEYAEAKKKAEDDPEYYILLEKANDKFQKAVKKAAADGGYDLVAEKGAVKPAKKKQAVPDITEDVIEALS